VRLLGELHYYFVPLAIGVPFLMFDCLIYYRDKPKFDEEEKAIRRNNKLGRTNKQLVEEESEAKEDNHENNEDEDLPEGWFSIVDPDSGDVYYSNEITGETTW
jgi:hypothetical protein